MKLIHFIKKTAFNWLINCVPLNIKQQIIEQLLKKKKLIKIDLQKTLINLGHHQFIIIGANDGISFDSNFKYFIENFEHGTLVEPHPYYFNLLEKNINELKSSNKITLINKAIANKSFELYAVKTESLSNYPDWIRGTSSFNQDNILTYGVKMEDLEKINVINLPVNELLAPFHHVNYIQIDTQGYDHIIIQDINFSEIVIDIIKFENVLLNHNEKEFLYSFLSSKGFLIIEDNIDTFAILEKTHIKFI